MPNHTVAVLAALWFCFGRHVVSEYLRPDCDNGRLLVERDLPADANNWGCPLPATWLDTAQRLPSVDTVYNPELARQVCMNKTLSYHHSIPNSGAFRPVSAQSGEYLYCPPQRWLNNLHHGAIVLLYHPCAAFRERPLVSLLAHSCLHGYIITPHPELNKSMPIALVSWGRTLELSTAASLDICDWLQSTMTSSNQTSGKYNFLLTRAAEQHGQKRTRQEGRHTEAKVSARQCCEQIISSWLKGGIKAEKSSPQKNQNGQELQGDSRQRRQRAAIPPKQDDGKANGAFQVSNVLTNRKNSSKRGPVTPSLGNGTLASPSDVRKAASPMEIQNEDFAVAHFVSKVSKPTQRMLLLMVPEKTKNASMKQGGSAKRSSTGDGQTLENDVVDLRERELAQDGDTHSKKGQDEFALLKHKHPEQGSDPAITADCNACTTGQHCECVKDSEDRTPLVGGGMPRIPGSNEAVWAAGALGFLLVLLTLSVLHTRLYRNWRTMPSLYWHDPQQDYDSVADVIRRRLQIAKRRQKRVRRQECALLPSSSSSDEYI